MEVTGENKRGSKGGRCKINNSCAPTYHLENMVGKNTPLVTAMKTKRYLENKSIKDM